jgi:hypothetical protein
MTKSTATPTRPSRATSEPKTSGPELSPSPKGNPQQSVECRANETPVAISDEAYQLATTAAALDDMKVADWIAMAVAETAGGRFGDWSDDANKFAERIREGEQS